MIKPKVFFTTGHYKNPDRAPSLEREAAKTVQVWIKRIMDSNPGLEAPIVPLLGQGAITDDEYQQMKTHLRSSSSPCPIGLKLNNKCIMWAEDERGLPDTIDHAKAILKCFDLTRIARLPL